LIHRLFYHIKTACFSTGKLVEKYPWIIETLLSLGSAVLAASSFAWFGGTTFFRLPVDAMPIHIHPLFGLQVLRIVGSSFA
jgi:hypothetical protein